MEHNNSFGCIGIYGVGLIGGSLGIDLCADRIADRVIGIGRNRERLRLALARQAVDDISTDLGEVIDKLDILVLATPLGTYRKTLEEFGTRFRPGTIVTDVGSAKETSIRTMEELLPDEVFPVGSHPMAGRERTGIENAEKGLFHNSVCAVCPTPRTRPEALDTVKRLWESVGSRVVILEPAHHDSIVARTSHLPHLVSAALAGTIDRFVDEDSHARRFLGSGFRDTTRIAAGDPVMWRDICADNRRAIVEALREFRENLALLEDRILNDPESLEHHLEHIRKFRQSIGRRGGGEKA